MREETEDYTTRSAEKLEETKAEPSWRIAVKYFLHGILFSALLLVLGFVYAIIFAGLIIIGNIIGLIIGIIVLFLLIGGLNNFLTDMIWGIRIKAQWKSLLSHGFVLFIVLLIADIPAIVIALAAPGAVTSIVLFVAYAFIGGFIAKRVAGHWEEGEEE